MLPVFQPLSTLSNIHLVTLMVMYVDMHITTICNICSTTNRGAYLKAYRRIQMLLLMICFSLVFFAIIQLTPKLPDSLNCRIYRFTMLLYIVCTSLSTLTNSNFIDYNAG